MLAARNHGNQIHYGSTSRFVINTKTGYKLKEGKNAVRVGKSRCKHNEMLSCILLLVIIR
jgi:adenylosuccinate lyase